MKKNMTTILNYTASILFFIVAIINFSNSNSGMGATYIALGAVFLALGTENSKKKQRS